jgi:hypothetical protein
MENNDGHIFNALDLEATLNDSSMTLNPNKQTQDQKRRSKSNLNQRKADGLSSNVMQESHS